VLACSSRRALRGGLAVGSMLAVLVASSVASAAGPTRTECGATAIDVYFWPHGHPAVPSFGFPAYAPAHIEIYRAGSRANSAQLAFADAKGGGFAKTCKSLPPASTSFKGSTGSATTARKITCHLSASAEFTATSLAPGTVSIGVQSGSSSTTVLMITFHGRTASAGWTSACTATPVPGVT
jgi:hypothetical protein